MYQLKSTGSILSILAYPQYGNHLVCHTGLSLVHCSYLSVGSLHQQKKRGYTRTHPVLPVPPVVQAHRRLTRLLGVRSFIGSWWTRVHAARTDQTQPRTEKVPGAERFCGRKKVVWTQTGSQDAKRFSGGKKVLRTEPYRRRRIVEGLRYNWLSSDTS